MIMKFLKLGKSRTSLKPQLLQIPGGVS